MTRDRDPTRTEASSGQELVDLQRTLYASGNPTRRWLHLARKSWVEGQVRRAALRERALEVGPGSGVYLPVLQESFSRVSATDVEPAHLADLRPRFPDVELILDDITSSRLEPASFDLILCSEVVEHIPDSPRAIRGMFELLRPGGTLILSTPQRYSPLELASKVAFLPGIVELVRRVYKEPVLRQGHINLMTRGEVRCQLENAGFRIGKEHFSGLYVPLLAEFGGHRGVGMARALEDLFRGSPLQWLLWTQCYVSEKPVG
ncbi:MAG: class I SAM-dependent methyltransferase [Longimicrobiales bacterium]|nr:class I SAM-dependent methyltransferase [Longimicrobiales bacterium]